MYYKITNESGKTATLKELFTLCKQELLKRATHARILEKEEEINKLSSTLKEKFFEDYRRHYRDLDINKLISEAYSDIEIMLYDKESVSFRLIESRLYFILKNAFGEEGTFDGVFSYKRMYYEEIPKGE